MLTATGQGAGQVHGGTFGALRQRLFAALLAVQLINAVAVWSHVVTVQWTLTERGESATVVSLAPAAMSLPFLLLSLPAGAVVGFASRERLIAVGTAASALAGVFGAALTAFGADHAVLLIATVVVVGSALVLVGVAWQSMLPELVDRSLLSSATVLDGAIYNVARAVGPLFAGLGLGLAGPEWTFLATAALFAICAVLMAAHEFRRPGRRGQRRPVLGEMGEGLRFVRYSPWTRRLLLRLVLFGLPASALWALISLVVHDRLGLGSRGFGVVMALIGAGAVVATFTLPPLRRRLSVTAFAAVGSTAYGLVLLTMGASTNVALVAGMLVLGGVAWVGVQSTWMMLSHQALPDWVRPRVIALVLFLFQGTQAVGSLAWGVVADLIGLPRALLAAAAVMGLSIILLMRGKLGSSAGIEPDLAEPDPRLVDHVAKAPDGPLLVRYDYEIEPDRHGEFVEAMAHLRLSRLRVGARLWNLGPHPDWENVFVETYRVGSREELLEQESVRVTVPERRLRTAVHDVAVHVAGPRTTPIAERPLAGRRRANETGGLHRSPEKEMSDGDE